MHDHVNVIIDDAKEHDAVGGPARNRMHSLEDLRLAGEEDMPAAAGERQMPKSHGTPPAMGILRWTVPQDLAACREE